MDDPAAAVARFHRRGARRPADPWHEEVRAIVAASGGDDALVQCHAALEQVLLVRTAAVRVTSVEGGIDETYRALVNSLTG
jgi:hypothetical protein